MGKKEDNEIELFKLMEKYKKKGRVTSEFRTPEHNKKVGGVPTSFHQFQFGGGDIMDLKRDDKDKFIQEAKSKGLFAYENKKTGQVHADIGPNKSKSVRAKKFEEFKDVEKANALKGQLMFGSPKQDEISKQDSGPIRKPQMAKPIEEELDPVQETKRVVESKGGPVVGNMGVHVKDNVDKRSLNMDNIESSAAKSEQAQLEGKQVGIDDKFMSALGFFLPAVIGGLVGQQTGEGGMGVRLGLQASGAYHKAKNAHEELQLKKKLAEEKANKKGQAKVDITPDFYDTKSGNPVFSRQTENGAEFIDDKGNVVSSDQVKSLRERQSEGRQKSVQSRHQERMTDGFMKTWRKKADPDIEGIKNIDSITNLIDSDSPITTAQVATFNARALFKEVGRLSDDDVKRAVVGLPLYKKVKNDMHQYMKGTMTDEVKKITKELLRVAKVHQKKVVRNLVEKGMAPHRIKTSGLSKEEYREALMMNAEVDLEEEEEKKKGFSRAEIEAKKAEIRARKK